jgi:uncharacterized protein (DUF433 family)
VLHGLFFRVIASHGKMSEANDLGIPNMKLPDFLTEAAYGSIRFTGHRIGLKDVVELYRDGYSCEKIQAEFPTLSLDLIARVIDFYHENRNEVDAYLAKCQAEIEQQRASTPRKLNIEELQKRMEEWGRLEKP